jgi:Kef-type K+ transport system membrane component KefB
MEHELVTLGILFFFSLVGGILASKFKQPILLGLLIVGAIIGPKALGLIQNEHALEPMIEFGAILMLFMVGLEFGIPRLQKIGLKAILIASLNSLILTFVGFTISLLLGFTIQVSLFIGVLLAFGSAVVIVKVLENKGMMDREEVPLLIAIVIIEDIIAVMVITFFSGMRDTSTGLLGNIESMLISMMILVLAYILFIKFIKPLLSMIMKNNTSEEVTIFTALAMCIGFAYLAYYLKLSPAVGAFLAGSIIASLPRSKEFEKAIMPYNLIISSFFFIAIGTLIDFSVIKEYLMVILVLTAAIMITKIIAFSTMVYLFANMRGDRMFFSSIAMFSMGEFSLLVAKESAKFNTGIDLVTISAAIVAISAVVMSLTIGYSNRLHEPTMENLPYKMRVKMEHIASYIRGVSEQLDLDNKHSKGLKTNVGRLVTGILTSLFILFGWRNIYISFGEMMSSNLIVLGYIVTCILLAISMFYTVYKSKSVSKSLSEIITNSTHTRNHAQSRRVVSLVASISLIALTILSFPFIMFMFDMNKIYVLIPVGLTILLIIQMRRLFGEVIDSRSEYHTPSNHYNGFSQKWDV